MRLLASVCLLVCVISNQAVPLNFRVDRNAGILMPGVHIVRTFSLEHDSNSNAPAVPAPIIFGEAPATSGDPVKEALPEGNEKEEFIPVFPGDGASSNSDAQTEGSNIIFLPGEKPTLFPSSPASSSSSSSSSATPSSSSSPSNTADEEGSGDDDKVFFPTKIRVDLINNRDSGTDQETPECGLEFGTMDINGTCTTLLARSGCPEDQWFIINEEGNGGECVPRLCPMGQLFYQGRCVGASDPSVCKRGQMLYVDFNGYAHCDCLPNFIYDPWSGVCYAQGDQGTCSFGHYMYVSDEGFVECKKNPCLMDGYVYHNQTHQCYKKKYNGFCDQRLLETQEADRTAECRAIAEHSIFDLPTVRACAPGSVRDYAQNCRRAFRVPSSSTYPTIYGGCPYSFTKDPRGTCRRTNSLFG